MRKLFTVLVFLSLASLASAQRIDELNGKHTQLYPTKDKADNDAGQGKAKPGGGGSNLLYWGGPVIHQAQVVAIFWGLEWQSGEGALTASNITSFFQNFGTTGEYNVITQYSDGSGNIKAGTINTATSYDGSAPQTNVTDSAVQAEVIKYINNYQGRVGDPSTVYEVFLPSTSYASYGTSDSCGGPNLAFCAYHSNFGYNGVDIKYSSMPYPSCGGCQWGTWSPAQNLEHFSCHETREAVTDPDGNAWFDRRGYEADDKCAWNPAPFLDAGYGYQWEWSNAVSACVQKSP